MLGMTVFLLDPSTSLRSAQDDTLNIIAFSGQRCTRPLQSDPTIYYLWRHA